MSRSHIAPSALSALIERATSHAGPFAHAAEAAMHIGITPGHLHDLRTGRRQGRSRELREAIAETLGVATWTFECSCSSPGQRTCESRLPFKDRRAA